MKSCKCFNKKKIRNKNKDVAFRENNRIVLRVIRNEMEIIGKTEATRAAEIRIRLFARSLNGGNEQNVRGLHRTSDRAELIRDALVSIRRLHRRAGPT